MRKGLLGSIAALAAGAGSAWGQPAPAPVAPAGGAPAVRAADVVPASGWGPAPVIMPPVTVGPPGDPLGLGPTAGLGPPPGPMYPPPGPYGAPQFQPPAPIVVHSFVAAAKTGQKARRRQRARIVGIATDEYMRGHGMRQIFNSHGAWGRAVIGGLRQQGVVANAN